MLRRDIIKLLRSAADKTNKAGLFIECSDRSTFEELASYFKDNARSLQKGSSYETSDLFYFQLYDIKSAKEIGKLDIWYYSSKDSSYTYWQDAHEFIKGEDFLFLVDVNDIIKDLDKLETKYDIT